MRNFPALPLGLLFLAWPFAAGARDTSISASQKINENCFEYYAVLAHNHMATLKPRGFTGYRALPTDETQAILSSYPRTEEGTRRQISDLVELRMEVERNGAVKDPELVKKLEALEWKNSNLGLIPGDIHGRAFIDHADNYSSLSPELKLEFIQKFASSRSNSFDVYWHTILVSETDPELSFLLRKVAAKRRLNAQIEYNPKLKESFLAGLRDVSTEKHWIHEELPQLSDKFLTELLNDPNPLVQTRATIGLYGRAESFLIGLLQRHPNPKVRLAAFFALPASTNRTYAGIVSIASRDESSAVRRIAVERLAQLRTGFSLQRLAQMTQDADQLVADKARYFMRDFDLRAAQEGRVVPKLQSLQPQLPDEQMIEIFHGLDTDKALPLVRDLPERSLEVRLAAMQSPNTQVRLEVVQELAKNTPLSNHFIDQLMADPVAEVRLAGLAIARKYDMNPHSWEVLVAAAEKDGDSKVRLFAREQLQEIGDLGNGISVHRSEQDLYRDYLKQIAKEFGAPGAREQDLVPLAAAQHVYLVPEAETAKDAATLVMNHKKFLDSVPLGYRVTEAKSDPLTGLKGAVYQSADAVERPMIVSLAGTETLADIIADANLGLLQMRGKSFQTLINRTVTTVKSAVDSGHKIPEIVVTGHSLGGALSTVFGTELKVALKEAGLDPELVRVVTWNGLGGKRPLERLGKYSRSEALKLKATNYFVKNDRVSAIGEQVGEKIPLPSLNISSPLKVHGIGFIRDAFEHLNGKEGADLADKLNYRKFYSQVYKYLTHVAKLTGPVTDSLQRVLYKAQDSATFNKIAQARLLWAETEGYKTLNPSYDWLKEELDGVASRMLLNQNKEAYERYVRYVEQQRRLILQQRQAETYLEEMAKRRRPVVPDNSLEQYASPGN